MQIESIYSTINLCYTTDVMICACIPCQAVTTHLIQNRQWELLPAAEFARRLHERAADGHSDHNESTLLRLATNLYCLELYDACRSEGQRQEKAYAELSRYLYDRAIYKYKDADLAQEFVQEALLRIFRLIDTCNHPGAFFEFAYLKLWQAATDAFRKRDRANQHLMHLPDSDVDEHRDGQAALWIDEDLPRADDVVASQEQVEQVLGRFTQLIEQSPRAKNQYLAVMLKFLYEWGDDEIAQKLETSVSNVHVLRTRGLKRLRGDAELRGIWDDT